MKKTVFITLVVAGTVLVALPAFSNLFAREKGHTFQENYQTAMERMRQMQPSSSESNRHETALHQARDLEPDYGPSYLSQILGVIMIVVGIWMARSRSNGTLSPVAVPSNGPPASPPSG